MTSHDELKEGRFGGLSGLVGDDEFERNDTAMRLKDSFRLVFERSVDPSFLLEGDVFVDCNDAALALLRCPAKEQLIGLRPLNISPGTQPDGNPSAERMRKMLDTAVSEGGVRFGWKHITFDGREILVDASLTAISLNGKPMIHAVLRDMPESRRGESGTKMDARFFLAIVERMPLAMAVVNEIGDYVYTNPRFKELFGHGMHVAPATDKRFAGSAVGEPPGYVPLREEPSDWVFTMTDKEKQKQVFRITAVKLPSGCLHVYQDITPKERAEDALLKAKAELALQSARLQEMNGALKVLLNEKEIDRVEIETKVVGNVNKLVLPYIDELKQAGLDAAQAACVDILESNLRHLISPFLERLGMKCANLTLREMRIADLIKSGKTTKEICHVLQMSAAAVNFHRNNIRKMLGLSNHKVNLAAYLSSL